MTPLAQRAWQDDPEETRSYAERIRELVERGDVRGARALVAKAVEAGAQEERLPYWQEILAPARTLGTIPEKDIDRTPDFQWLDENASSYRGKYVALFNGELLACGKTLDEVTANLKARGWESCPGRRALLHRIY